MEGIYGLLVELAFGVFSVKQYGAKGDGVTDDTAAIQDAINAAHAAGGGIVWFPIPAVYYKLQGTLTLTDMENITLFGEVGTRNQFAGASAVQLINFNGNAVMLDWRESAAAGSLRGCAIRNITFNCNEVAGTGLLLGDWYGGLLENVYVREPKTVGIDITTSNNAGTLGFQGNTLSGVAVRAVGATNPIGMRWRSASAGGTNVSGNTFINCSIFHKNGAGLDAGDSDSNFLYGLIVTTGGAGTGVGILLRASNVAGQGHCRHNMFIGCQTASGVTAQGTGFTTPSVDNLFFISTGNGVPAPTIETGANLTWLDDAGSRVILPGLPTADPHVVGQLWSNAGVLTVSAG